MKPFIPLPFAPLRGAACAAMLVCAVAPAAHAGPPVKPAKRPAAPPPKVMKPALLNKPMYTPLPFAGATLSLIEAAITSGSLPNLFGSIPPDAGTEYAVFTIMVKNPTKAPLSWTMQTLSPALQTVKGGAKFRAAVAILAREGKKFEGVIKPGEEKPLEIHFQIPKGDTPQNLVLSQPNGPSYRFDVRPVFPPAQ